MCDLTLWSVSFDAMEQDSEVDNARELCSAEHDGDVLGLAVTGGATHRMYTASGAGGVCCYVVSDLDKASPSLLRTWRALAARRPCLTTYYKVLRGNTNFKCSVYVVPGSRGRTHRFSGSSECLDQIFTHRGAHGDHTHVDRVRVVGKKTEIRNMAHKGRKAALVISRPA